MLLVGAASMEFFDGMIVPCLRKGKKKMVVANCLHVRRTETIEEVKRACNGNRHHSSGIPLFLQRDEDPFFNIGSDKIEYFPRDLVGGFNDRGGWR
mmetsp:Transcript_10476/g.22390  ORF Transcript_10476/g.22390 Transcript_10476/m.22390 type:complete len:96 (-) Transcript_10476:99-386(-)